MGSLQFISHQVRSSICLDNASDGEEIEEGESSNSMTTWENANDWFYLSATQKRILADKVWAAIMYQSLRWKNAL